MNLDSLGIGDNMLPQHSQKPFWVYKFSRKHICTAPFFEAQELHSCLYISVYLRKKISVPETQ